MEYGNKYSNNNLTPIPLASGELYLTISDILKLGPAISICIHDVLDLINCFINNADIIISALEVKDTFFISAT